MINEIELLAFRNLLLRFGACKLPDVELAAMHELLFSNIDETIANFLFNGVLCMLKEQGFVEEELIENAETFEYLLDEIRSKKLSNLKMLLNDIEKERKEFMDWLKWYMDLPAEERQREGQKRRNRLKLYGELWRTDKMN